MTPTSPIRKDTRLLSPPRRNNGKERRNPSITPRKFRRFFTPRTGVSSHLASGHISPARKALRDLAAPTLNHRLQTPAPSSPLKASSEYGQDDQDENTIENDLRAKRRKLQHTPESSPFQPLHLEPLLPLTSEKPSVLLSPIQSIHSSQTTLPDLDESDCEDLDQKPIRRLAPISSRGFAGQLLQRGLGGRPCAGRSYMSYPASDWKTETADFCSQPSNVHNCTSHDGPGRCIPFCTAACNTNSLVAVGDEEGRVRLLDSSGDASQPFSDIHVSFPAHSNAIIDLAFSSDDYLLATASGDQTGRVIDVVTQKHIAILQHHTASLKQVRFQPGSSNGSVLATSSRDGSVQIWDLRCKGPVSEILTDDEPSTGLSYVRSTPPKQGCAINSIYDAHARTARQVKQATTGPQDTPSRGELPGRIGDVSVTALQFLPEGREHLLLTACEADACIKLWDIRSTSNRHKTTPISATAPPTSHSYWRPFGIPSLALNTDASRLYALCKDNTVYAYSMAHLMLGHAPELSSREPARRRHGNTTHNGLGPLYGFRHPSLHATSFYVKCAVRPAKDGRSEVLAVGSSDACAVVFPTAERYFRHDLTGAMSTLSLEQSTIATSTLPPSAFTRSHRPLLGPPLFQRTASSSRLAAMREKDDIPMYRNGTPLVRGHDREVGALAWTDQGKLVTVGDDYLVRCWSEDRERAKDLRTGGETEGRRWGCGWADVGEDWDGDAEDDDDE
ncbi:hypothetical protein G7054_g8419 [Neopestalotiopsis clavispora]|nr:hypothetical protein G7054_g8419 [Neopestalotiopsis clavispora]